MAKTNKNEGADGLNAAENTGANKANGGKDEGKNSPYATVQNAKLANRRLACQGTEFSTDANGMARLRKEVAKFLAENFSGEWKIIG